jgi:hypothetical protein
MMRINIIEDRLRSIELPPLTRPAIGPYDDPTEELACWGATLYAYSSIAHVRTVLAGLVGLANSGNTPTATIVSRHIFEWTAHACYMQENLTGFMAAREWKPAFELTLRADTGNQWVKKHGHKYDDSNYPEEALSPIRIKHLIVAYSQYQTNKYGKTDAEDSYGFLSEFSHPNGVCFQHYRDIIGADIHFLQPPATSSYAGINHFIIEWLLFMFVLLGLGKEQAVRSKLAEIVQALAQQAK